MRALLIASHGSHTHLNPVDVDPRPLGPGDARVEVHAAGVNPSDVGSAEGRFANAPLPRILGRDFAGRVVEGPPEWLGADVWGTGGDLGIFRDGTHAEQLVIPIAALARRPSNLSAEEAASVGVPFTTASMALDEGQLSKGDFVIVAGAAGSVGAAALELANAGGANVIALVRREADAARLNHSKVVAIASSEKNDLVDVTREATDGRGAAVALNGVGASVFSVLTDALADGGRMIVYSAAGGREIPLDLFTLYRRHLHVSGINTLLADATGGARILEALTPLFETGTIAPHRAIECVPLSDAANAYARVAGGTSSKIVLKTKKKT